MCEDLLESSSAPFWWWGLHLFPEWVAFICAALVFVAVLEEREGDDGDGDGDGDEENELQGGDANADPAPLPWLPAFKTIILI